MPKRATRKAVIDQRPYLAKLISAYVYDPNGQAGVLVVYHAGGYLYALSKDHPGTKGEWPTMRQLRQVPSKAFEIVGAMEHSSSLDVPYGSANEMTRKLAAVLVHSFLACPKCAPGKPAPPQPK